MSQFWPSHWSKLTFFPFELNWRYSSWLWQYLEKGKNFWETVRIRSVSLDSRYCTYIHTYYILKRYGNASISLLNILTFIWKKKVKGDFPSGRICIRLFLKTHNWIRDFSRIKSGSGFSKVRFGPEILLTVQCIKVLLIFRSWSMSETMKWERIAYIYQECFSIFLVCISKIEIVLG